MKRRLGRTDDVPLRQLFLSGLMGFVGLLATTASATVIYQYTGPGFQVFQDNSSPPTYGPSNHVSVTLTSPALLPSNLPPGSDISPYLTSDTFSDGVQIITDTTPPTNPDLFGATDNSGNIVSWVLDASALGGSIVTEFDQLLQHDNALASVGCHLVGVYQAVCPKASVDTSTASGQPAGTWITIVPEPSTSLLLVMGVAGFAAMRRGLMNA